MTSSAAAPDLFRIDSAARLIARRNHEPGRVLHAPDPGGDGSRTAAALHRAASTATRQLNQVQENGAGRWRQITQLAEAATTADHTAAARLGRIR